MYLLYLVFSDHDINTEIMGSSWRNFSQMIQTLKSSHNFCANLKCTIFWEINVKGAISFNKKGEKFYLKKCMTFFTTIKMFFQIFVFFTFEIFVAFMNYVDVSLQMLSLRK